MIIDNDAERLAAYCRRTLPLAGSELGPEFGYRSPALCVIDAVWSIGVRYEGVQNMVRRYCDYLESTPELCNASLSVLTRDMTLRGIPFYTEQVFQNRQRTSSRGGILKAEAVYRYAGVLLRHGIDELPDLRAVLPNEEAERQLMEISGHGSGISFKYFQMLTGSYDLVKPDRMILRFLEAALKRTVTVAEAQQLLASTSRHLQQDHPHLDARLLDNLIWKHQRLTSPA